MTQYTSTRNLPWARSTPDYPPSNQAHPPPPSLNQPPPSNPSVTQSLGNMTSGYSFGAPAMPPPSQTPQPQYSSQNSAMTSQPPPQMGGALAQAQAQAQALVAMQQAQQSKSSTSNYQPNVSYPLPRASQMSNQSQIATTQKQRVYTGEVTKLHDNFGLVDEEVFFQPTCVKGQLPKVGDRVLVEATFNEKMPFKWNATRIQMLPHQSPAMAIQERTMKSKFGGPQGGSKPGFVSSNSSHPPPLMGSQTTLPPAHAKTQINRFGRDRNHTHMDRRERKDFRQNLPIKRRSRTPPPRARTPPPRKRMRTIPRYVVQVPKISLSLKLASVMTLKARYSNMYVPSDFFSTNYSWSEVFPVDHSFQAGSPCDFVVMHKDVESVSTNDAVLDPPDADYLYSAKVMLLAMPSPTELYHKSCSLSEDQSEVKEAFQHPTRLINFLVGCKGKNEPMAIGGPWSQSLDGPNPDTDPKVLIKTAIRTTKALTGIDLSHCAQWYRFAEISYHRPEEVHKGKTTPSRVETTVIFLPDVWSCMPTRHEWQDLQDSYKKQLVKKLAVLDGSGAESEKEEEVPEVETEPSDLEPTHYKELDPKSMKIADLRQELEAREISSKGLKSQLIARLTKTLKTEQEKDEGVQKEETGTPSKDDKGVLDPKDTEKKREDDEKKREKDKLSLEKKYVFPDNPGIMVHPSPTAKSGKFDCSVISLSVLLDYRPEDNKEHSFEVSLFAEMFNEMLMRDFGFEIYKTLFIMPEKKEEEKKDKKEEEKKEKKTDEKDKDHKDKVIKKEKEDEKEVKVKQEDEDGKEDGEDDDDKKDKKRKRKFITVDPKLLLSCVYFDQNHSGYIADKDLEDIVHILGLNLSRSQVKKLVQRGISRDQFNYRKFTDKEENEAKTFDRTDIEDRISFELDDVQPTVSATGSPPSTPCTPRTKSKRNKPAAKEGNETMVTYKGSQVDLDSLMTRLAKSEESRNELEAKMQCQSTEIEKLNKKNVELLDTSNKSKDEGKKLKSELDEQTEQCETAETLNRGYLKVLFKVKDSMGDMLGKVSEVVEGQQDAIENMDTN